MLYVHRYIFLYADDLYYSRDAQLGLDYLPHFMVKELQANGRVWIGVSMFAVLKPQIEFFRILNPLILMLTVIIITKMSTISSFRLNQRSSIALLCASLFFLFLPIEIGNTTIYYAACAFNYLYPSTLALLYAYLLYNYTLNSRVDSISNPNSNSSLCSESHKYSAKMKYALLLLAFFVGSSTQQVGMIGIGFTVLTSFYLAFIRKKVRFKVFLSYYFVLFAGYSIVTYGSIQRMLFEKGSGTVIVLKDIISELLKTNIFSLPVAPYVLLISLSCLFWFFHFSFRNGDDFSRFTVIVTRLMGFTLSFALLGYIYIVLYQKYPIHFTSENILTFYGLSLITFTLIYLSSILYVSTLILIKKRYPFLLFNSINAIGAQVMLLVADARFAASYKIMFPSLLLMSVFIVYSVIEFRQNTLFLSLTLFLVSLSVGQRLTAFIALAFVLLSLVLTHTCHSSSFKSRHYTTIFQKGIALIFSLSAFTVFSLTSYGYKGVAVTQNFNLKAIHQYHETSRSSELRLKKVPVTQYGYNVGNWNTMPYFMRQCYGVREDAAIYVDEKKK